MNHWIIAPVILPAMLAPLMVLAVRHDLGLQRLFSLAGSVALLAVAIGLTVSAAGGPPQVYPLGNWPAPFGIVLVLDRLSALMVLLTALLAFGVLVYTVASGWDARGRHFHPLLHFLLMGVCGAFLTGDLFNLFVFYEVLLIASYGLMLHGGGAVRLKAGVQYVAINLAGSALFLFAVGTIYAVTGTLNMADLALAVPKVAPDDIALLRVGGLLLLMVFGVKAALVPLHFWLPGAYGAAPAPVAAMFAIMTKVGAYSILRVYTLIFGADAGAAAGLAGAWLLPAALVTLVLGIVGVVGTRALMAMVCFSLIGSMGMLLTAVALFTPAATAAALYYLIHSTFSAAGLFLIAEQITRRRGAVADRLIAAPDVAQGGVLAALFFAATLGMAGLPPFSGFIGKLLVLDSARHVPHGMLIWAVILTTSLAALVGYARAGSVLFWKSAETAGRPDAVAHPAVPLVVAAGMVAVMAALSGFGGPVMVYLDATAAELHAPAGYIAAVLGPDSVTGVAADAVARLP